MWKCPNGCEIQYGIVCGGETPWYNHGYGPRDASNIYFLMELETNTFVRSLVSTEIPFDLTESDWCGMDMHADAGCCDEPQCPVCKEYLENRMNHDR
jgi:hypothetical protein